jgi:hypothetical protein
VRVADSYLLLGRLGRVEGNLPVALADYRRAAAIQISDRPTRARTRPDGVTGYLDVLLDQAAASQAERPALLAEAFAAAQIPRGGETARAITNMAARLDVADPAVRAAAREYQEATRARDRIRQTLAVETFKEQESRNLAQEEATKGELRAAEEKIASLEGRLQAELPRYAQITAARPVPVAELAPLRARSDRASRSPTASSSRSTPRPPRACMISCWPRWPSRCAVPRISWRCRAGRC